MHEVEIKARLESPERTERLLAAVADFSFRCIKTDRYWSIGKKTIRTRLERIGDTETVLITHKLKRYSGAIETNRELEFELPAAALPVFTAMLEGCGFICTAEKQKDTKVFIPHADIFAAGLLDGAERISAELSVIEPIGSFLEIEILYPDANADTDTASGERHLRNARLIFDTLLAAVEVPQDAIEPRPYNELLAHERRAETGHSFMTL